MEGVDGVCVVAACVCVYIGTRRALVSCSLREGLRWKEVSLCIPERIYYILFFLLIIKYSENFRGSFFRLIICAIFESDNRGHLISRFVHKGVAITMILLRDYGIPLVDSL